MRRGEDIRLGARRVVSKCRASFFAMTLFSTDREHLGIRELRELKITTVKVKGWISSEEGHEEKSLESDEFTV